MCVFIVLLFFFFKQKTAYEVRISDWSSDVCSSDLFWTQDYLTIDRTFTLANYREAWTEPLYRVLMLRSLAVSAVVTAATVLLAYPMAYYLSFHGGERKALWLFLITIPFWTSYLLRVFAWKIVLGYNGVVNASLLELGIIAEPMEFLLYNVNSVVITLAHAWAPFAILPIFVSLEKIDRSLLEAATDLGAGPVRRFLRVTLPLSLPGITAACLLVFIPTVRSEERRVGKECVRTCRSRWSHHN